jgi:glyoxalase family protein
MPARTRGIHHVTAIATDPQVNVDFYAGVLGLRLVKKTVNFDDPGSYHLYFGDEVGGPGTAMTFFAWPDGRRGSRGAGQATVTSFATPADSLDFWSARLESFGVLHEPVGERFGERNLVFYDPDGLKLELVASPEASALPAWKDGPIAAEHALRGFHSVTLAVRTLHKTERILADLMGFEREGEEGGRVRLVAGSPEHPGRRVDLLPTGESLGEVATGTVHHVAFRVDDESSQLALRAELGKAGQRVTDVLERNYFRSIYFREPNGVLFEIATDPPGFPVDESVEELGSSLKLPPWLEPQRERIEATLPPVEVRREAGDPPAPTPDVAAEAR